MTVFSAGAIAAGTVGNIVANEEMMEIQDQQAQKNTQTLQGVAGSFIANATIQSGQKGRDQKDDDANAHIGSGVMGVGAQVADVGIEGVTSKAGTIEDGTKNVTQCNKWEETVSSTKSGDIIAGTKTPKKYSDTEIADAKHRLDNVDVLTAKPEESANDIAIMKTVKDPKDTTLKDLKEQIRSKKEENQKSIDSFNQKVQRWTDRFKAVVNSSQEMVKGKFAMDEGNDLYYQAEQEALKTAGQVLQSGTNSAVEGNRQAVQTHQQAKEAMNKLESDLIQANAS